MELIGYFLTKDNKREFMFCQSEKLEKTREFYKSKDVNFFNFSYKVNFIDEELAKSIVKTGKPIGKFIVKTVAGYKAIDNETGEALSMEYNTIYDCMYDLLLLEKESE